MFKECQSLVASIREFIASHKSPFSRPWELQGRFQHFASAGPESRFISVRTGIRPVVHGTNIVGFADEFDQVEKYTDAEVKKGKERNAAARMAILDHLLNGSREGTDYEQCELVRLAVEWWWTDGKCRQQDGVKAEDIFEVIAYDATRSPGARAAAILYLPPERQRGVNQIMAEVLRDDRINHPFMDQNAVFDALRYLNEHGGAEGRILLAGIQSTISWKQAEINRALGLPASPPEEGTGLQHTVEVNVTTH